MKAVMTDHEFRGSELQRLALRQMLLDLRLLLLTRVESKMAFHMRLGRFLENGGKSFPGAMQLAAHRVGRL